jgi:adenosylcobinamide-GDP ribazoletransferase
MKDSRVGAFGAIAVALALLCKVALLALIGAVSSPWMCAALMGVHIVSRTWPLFLIRLLPHVGDDDGSKSKPLADQITWGSLATAVAWSSASLATVVVLAPGGITLGLAVWATALLSSALMFGYLWRLFARRLQGFTGDCLGTVQQLCELSFYLGLALGLGRSAGV